MRPCKLGRKAERRRTVRSDPRSEVLIVIVLVAGIQVTRIMVSNVVEGVIQPRSCGGTPVEQWVALRRNFGADPGKVVGSVTF